MTDPTPEPTTLDKLLAAIAAIDQAQQRGAAIIAATEHAIEEARATSCGVVVNLEPGADPIAWPTPYAPADTLIVLAPDWRTRAHHGEPLDIRLRPDDQTAAPAPLRFTHDQVAGMLGVRTPDTFRIVDGM